jgi:antitoxin component YwqK of YwqJK toxin-antitoxin module
MTMIRIIIISFFFVPIIWSNQLLCQDSITAQSKDVIEEHYNFYSNGFIKSFKIDYDSINYNEVIFYKTGSLQSHSFYDLLLGVVVKTAYWENGNLMSRYTLSDSLVEYKSYHSNGHLWVEGFWVPKSISYFGKWTEYYESGLIKSVGQYKNYNKESKDLFYDQTKIGKWEYYNVNGEIEKKELYNSNGKLIESN